MPTRGIPRTLIGNTLACKEETMAKYIDCDAAIALAKDIIVPTKSGYDYRHRCIDPQDLAELPAADVVERKTGKNVATEYDDCDQFVCSECGIELQDWHRVERDEDDGNVTYHEYRFRFCPNCGAQMIGGDDDV
jgi:predicted RNA-binding Zn-ribbon protein involved in translation (DUF1610 family)